MRLTLWQATSSANLVARVLPGKLLAAHFRHELAAYSICVTDVAGGDKIPRKGGPGIAQAYLFVINEIDLAPLAKPTLGVMEHDSRRMRGQGPFSFVRASDGYNLAAIIDHLHAAKAHALAAVRANRR